MTPEDCLGALYEAQSNDSSVTVETSEMIVENITLGTVEPMDNQREIMHGVDRTGADVEFDIEFSITGDVVNIMLYQDERGFCGDVQSVSYSE